MTKFTVRNRGLTQKANRLLPPRLRVRRSQALWNRQSRQSTYGFISHLQSGDWDPTEFALVGQRFVDQMLLRYRRHGTVPETSAAVVEIGCGVGRFLKPLSQHFKSVIGLDFSREMLDSARSYCGDIANIRLQLNDGFTLASCPDESADFVVSAGVFQHIPDITAITTYIREGLRALKPGGILLFQFEGNRVAEVGYDQVGARITARQLDSALAGERFRICEVSCDPRDPVRNIVCVLAKTPAPTVARFVDYPLTEEPWLIGVYEGIQTDADMKARLVQPPQRLTFYD